MLEPNSNLYLYDTLSIIQIYINQRDSRRDIVFYEMFVRYSKYYCTYYRILNDTAEIKVYFFHMFFLASRYVRISLPSQC